MEPSDIDLRLTGKESQILVLDEITKEGNTGKSAEMQEKRSSPARRRK